MKAFDDLLEVANTLNAPGGCPWDHKQTFFSLQPYVLEEAHEVVEAVDGQKSSEIIEELGDLLYVVVFYAKIAEKENKFSMQDVLETVTAKLIRRHPHVFGSVTAKTEEEIVSMWNQIKKNEEGKEHRTSALDGIPDQMPLLAKAQKTVKAFIKNDFSKAAQKPRTEEEKLSQDLWDLVLLAEKSGIDIEGAFRRKLSEEKKAFVAWEEVR